MVDAEPDFVVVGEAGDGAEAVTPARQLRPDMVLMDIRMPALDGLTATSLLIPAAAPCWRPSCGRRPAPDS